MSGVSCAHIHAELIHAPEDDVQADEEELPIGTEVEVATSYEMENVFGVVNNPVEPSVSDINKELLNELETVLRANIPVNMISRSEATRFSSIDSRIDQPTIVVFIFSFYL
ncbi:hypothetical protein Q1695_006858 [Nippostrongylus brasiliensis]|nr:hypothetical protein Q1695_006858 [Nippostrongylus brasiliensis]